MDWGLFDHIKGLVKQEDYFHLELRRFEFYSGNIINN